MPGLILTLDTELPTQHPPHNNFDYVLRVDNNVRNMFLQIRNALIVLCNILASQKILMTGTEEILYELLNSLMTMPKPIPIPSYLCNNFCFHKKWKCPQYPSHITVTFQKYQSGLLYNT
jgi:hypothetical protein